MDLPQAFASLAGMATSALGAPYHSGTIISQATPGSYDDDGEFVPGSAPTERACMVQIDAASEYMKANGYVEGEYRFIILAASFTGEIDTDAVVRVNNGPFAGQWLVSSLERDPAGIGYVGKGKRS